MKFKNKPEIIALNKPDISDFAGERNKLLKKTKSKWIFFLDSDEKMSKTLEKELKTLSSKWKVEEIRHTAYIVKRRNFFVGTYIGTDKIIRLGKKNAGKWERKVHEVWRVKGKVGVLKNPIIHNTAKNLHEYIGKLNRYSTLHAEANIKEGKKFSLFKIIFYPKLKFIQSIIIGRGLVFSIFQAFHSFLSWAKQWELQK